MNYVHFNLFYDFEFLELKKINLGFFCFLFFCFWVIFLVQIRDSMFGFGAAKISERLKGFVSGCASEGEMQLPELWDFKINPELWEF